ncbi:PilZ domain-containing protein [bacterium]|nr:PilZ domain-containing protein [candidate division CSSED10-310 bacterium]
MRSDINEPENRPRERIEKLISSKKKPGNRRIHERIPVEPGMEVFFPIVCRGEIVDVSREGISIRFKPVEAPSLESGETLNMTMTLDNHSLTIPATIRRMEARFGVVVLGMEFDSEGIEIDA